MKLYATITSERATKGQGGNRKLDVTILWDKTKRIKLLDMSLEMLSNNEKPIITIHTIHDIILEKILDILEAKNIRNSLTIAEQLKGKKQKGEVERTCDVCGETYKQRKDSTIAGKNGQWEKVFLCLKHQGYTR